MSPGKETPGRHRFTEKLGRAVESQAQLEHMTQQLAGLQTALIVLLMTLGEAFLTELGGHVRWQFISALTLRMGGP